MSTCVIVGLAVGLVVRGALPYCTEEFREPAELHDKVRSSTREKRRASQ